MIGGEKYYLQKSVFLRELDTSDEAQQTEENTLGLQEIVPVVCGNETVPEVNTAHRPKLRYC